MLNSLKRTGILWVQSKTGLTTGLVASALIAAGAAVMTFVFVCVTGYVWLSTILGPVFSGLVSAGIFVVIAIVAAAASALLRRRTKQRAIIERAVLAPGEWILIDPKVLNFAVQTGRVLGWQRILPVALLGIVVTRLVRQARREPDEA